MLIERGVIVLNPRQKKFAEYYAQCGNTVQSALKAGYSSNYANKRAHELLENVGVAEHIKALAEKASKERILTAFERQAILSDIARSEFENQMHRVRAIDTLNKMTGEYIDKIEVSGEINTTSDKLDSILEQLKE